MLGEKLMRLRKKQGYSQQEVADKLSVSRQTISNWECDQALPAVDKAMELAQLYNISLDDLMENEIEIVSNNKTKDLHLLQYLIGKTCTLECTRDAYLLDISTSDGKVLIVDVNDDWVKVQYHRTKKGSFIKKETVTKEIKETDRIKNILAGLKQCDCELIVKETMFLIDVPYSVEGKIIDLDDDWVLIVSMGRKTISRMIRITMIKDVIELTK